ncbi:MAG: Rieske 2Fe-2S domain-containing protein [Pseudomonadota bacterium]
MSHPYVPVQWNRKKVWYDLTIFVGVLVFIAVYMVFSASVASGDESLSPMILLIRAFATCAFVMLTMILCIGPLARLDKRFLPLLYNRRHFGVAMFLVALTHGILAMIWYHGFGVIAPLTSIFSSPGTYTSLADVPFQPFGVAALAILFLMAATSHDFWNTNLGPVVWKSLHMSVYVAYLLLVIHIAAGALQEPATGFPAWLLTGSVVLVLGLHVSAGIVSREKPIETHTGNDWIDVGSWQDIENDRALVVSIGSGERVAVFRYDQTRIAAVGNVCKHQGGPLGEGKVIDGCITCPWHGYQYRPEDGCSPPPYDETIATYRTRVEGDRVLLDPNPLPDGTARPVTMIGGDRETEVTP